MANYISSRANRFYVATEATYGTAAPITATNRFPAVELGAQQVVERAQRHDKTGTRTFLGTSKLARRHTAFEVKTYLTSWAGSGEPAYGPLFYGALGAPAQISGALTVANVLSPTQFQTTVAHGLSVSSAVSYSNEIRFVTSVLDTMTVAINAPFQSSLAIGVVTPPTVTYRLATALPSLTLYDYWDPQTAVDRIITGAGVDSFAMVVNGDYHEFAFKGVAADLLDTTSFATNSSGLPSFPIEPALASFDYSIVPGHLGQVWLGSPTNQFFTLTEAKISITNKLDVRSREFGSLFPRSVVPGDRSVSTSFRLFAMDDAQTSAIYQAAKQRATVPAMFQLGQQQGQLMGLYMPAVTPDVPEFDDRETRLQWGFTNNLAQGVGNDEVVVAFA